MPASLASSRPAVGNAGGQPASGAGPVLAAALLGFFVITVDVLVVNVALPGSAHAGRTGQRRHQPGPGRRRRCWQLTTG